MEWTQRALLVGFCTPCRDLTKTTIATELSSAGGYVHFQQGTHSKGTTHPATGTLILTVAKITYGVFCEKIVIINDSESEGTKSLMRQSLIAYKEGRRKNRLCASSLAPCMHL